MKFSSLLFESRIFLDHHFSNYNEVIDFIAEKVSNSTRVSKEQVKEALLRRESLGSTYIGHRLALPHGYLDSLPDIVVLFIRCDQDVALTLDHSSHLVKYIFSVLTPKSKANSYVKILSSIARIVMHQAHILDQAHSPSELIKNIASNDLEISQFITAYDLISTNVSVRLYDTIASVVDMMKKHTMTFLPVVNEHNQITGIIDMADLFSAIYPEQMLSQTNMSIVEDLGTSDVIIDPLKHYWEKEEHRIVGDIMRAPDTYTIQETASYAEIIARMTKFHHHYLVVIDDNDEVKGIIDTSDIVHKIIRA